MAVLFRPLSVVAFSARALDKAYAAIEKTLEKILGTLVVLCCHRKPTTSRRVKESKLDQDITSSRSEGDRGRELL